MVRQMLCWMIGGSNFAKFACINNQTPFPYDTKSTTTDQNEKWIKKNKISKFDEYHILCFYPFYLRS